MSCSSSQPMKSRHKKIYIATSRRRTRVKNKINHILNKAIGLIIGAVIIFFTPNLINAAAEGFENEKNNSTEAIEIIYEPSEWAKDLAKLYQVRWYENPQRHAKKGEFLLVQLRLIQASLERQGLEKLSAKDNILNFKDTNELSKEIKNELKILNYLGVLSGTPEGYMKMDDYLKRAEAAKIISVFNKSVFRIASIRSPKVFSDTINHWANKDINVAYQIAILNGALYNNFNPEQGLTLEQILQLLENQIGYSGITSDDIAVAMSESFKVSLDPEQSKNKTAEKFYSKYEEKMKTYGYYKMYNNKSIKFDETVTKIEALKFALAVTLNTDKIDGDERIKNQFPDAEWVEFAKTNKIIEEDINSSNYMEKVTYIDAIKYFNACKKQFLNDTTSSNPLIILKDISKYKTEEQVAIKDMITNKIIYPISDSINANEYLLKGQLNELAVNYAQQYSTITDSAVKININPEIMPINAWLYPYIIENIENSVYEKPFITKNAKLMLSAKDIYLDNKKICDQAKIKSEGFFNAILNIDYKTINAEDFKNRLAEYIRIDEEDNSINEYIKFVKENEITIKGVAGFQEPVVYFDGEKYRARLILDFDIVNSKTKNNILFIDINNKTKTIYEKVNYNIISDYPLDFYGEAENMYTSIEELYNSIISKESSGIQKEITFRLNKTKAYPGDSIAIYISHAKGLNEFIASASFYNNKIKFYKYDEGYVGLIPIYAWSKPGSYKIQTTNLKTNEKLAYQIDILPKTFDTQYLKVSKSTVSIKTDNNSAKDQVYFDAARANPIQEKLWDGAFLQPVKGEISTEYNATRYTNDDPVPSRHLAIDIANITGTPILASNHGKVVLARKLIVTGNTIVIDHGMNIFTSYFHLNEINIKQGSFVKKGDVIGKMGSTGYSTGPHLHFAIWKDGNFLNPWTLFKEDPISFN